jgi:hypothetical protein
MKVSLLVLGAYGKGNLWCKYLAIIILLGFLAGCVYCDCPDEPVLISNPY